MMLPKNAHRNARMRKPWLDRRKEIITPESRCSMCGVLSSIAVIQIHHISKEAYKEENYHLYEKLDLSLPIILVCKKCHSALHKGMQLCKKCRVAYHYAQFPSCFKCSGKEETELSKIMHEVYQNQKDPNYWDKR